MEHGIISCCKTCLYIPIRRSPIFVYQYAFIVGKMFWFSLKTSMCDQIDIESFHGIGTSNMEQNSPLSVSEIEIHKTYINFRHLQFE